MFREFRVDLRLMQDDADWHDTSTGTGGYELQLSETTAKSR
jgi:hypothetical protein